MIRAALIALLAVFVSCSAKHEAAFISENMPAEVESGSVIDEAQINSAMKERTTDLNKCFEDEKGNEASSSLKRVMALFTLQNDGTVKDSGVISIYPLSDEFVACIKGVVSSSKFPPTSFQRPVLVFYPVEYRFVKQN